MCVCVCVCVCVRVCGVCVCLPALGVYIWLQEEKTEEKVSLLPGGTTAPGGVAKENGVKEPTTTPFGGDGLREPLSIDKRITETSG